MTRRRRTASSASSSSCSATTTRMSGRTRSLIGPHCDFAGRCRHRGRAVAHGCPQTGPPTCGRRQRSGGDLLRTLRARQCLPVSKALVASTWSSPQRRGTMRWRSTGAVPSPSRPASLLSEPDSVGFDDHRCQSHHRSRRLRLKRIRRVVPFAVTSDDGCMRRPGQWPGVTPSAVPVM
jgi:hypothetical protein